MGNLGTTEILVIAGVIILLFGATKLPQMARSLGQSARVFKAETRGMKDDEQTATQQTAQSSQNQSSQSEPQQLNSGNQDKPQVASPIEDTQRNDSKN